MILTVIILVTFVLWGLPMIIKLSSFIADLQRSGNPITATDTTPPAPPRLDSLPDVTKDKTVDINGTAEAGSTVVLLLGENIEETISNASGRFSHTYDLRDGENKISAYTKDVSGNQSDKTDTIVIVFDNTKPELTISQPTNGAKFFGSDNKVEIKGQTESGVDVTINGSFVRVNSDGSFTKIIALTEGINEIKIKSEDSSNNATEVSISVEYVK